MNEPVNVRAHDAAGDGVGDDTEAISALPERGGVLYFPPRHYIRDLDGHENAAIERNPGSLKALCPPE